ncbi:MAG: hypothetical protein MI749_05885, partial [Desulfovibrionales bacterium]|nr:hypothetical protein [Desulfovibrionales bacterium]
METQTQENHLALKGQNLIYFMIVTTLVKWIISTGKKVLYAFAPAISRVLGIPATMVTALIALNQTTALFVPWLMAKTSTHGYRTTALAAYALTLFSFLSMGIFPIHWVIILGIISMGLAKSVI